MCKCVNVEYHVISMNQGCIDTKFMAKSSNYGLILLQLSDLSHLSDVILPIPCILGVRFFQKNQPCHYSDPSRAIDLKLQARIAWKGRRQRDLADVASSGLRGATVSAKLEPWKKCLSVLNFHLLNLTRSGVQPFFPSINQIRLRLDQSIR